MTGLTGHNGSVRHALEKSSQTDWQGIKLSEEFYVDTLEAEGGCEKFIRGNHQVCLSEVTTRGRYYEAAKPPVKH